MLPAACIRVFLTALAAPLPALLNSGDENRRKFHVLDKITTGCTERVRKMKQLLSNSRSLHIFTRTARRRAFLVPLFFSRSYNICHQLYLFLVKTDERVRAVGKIIQDVSPISQK